jgi:L-alanine-DL-glutamate epimerase-like enolase superfamily enzyme
VLCGILDCFASLAMTATFTIRGIQAFCYRYPLTTPVVTSFGEMRDRPALFVRVEDDDGQAGWGEAWCNFPSMGAEHRTRLINDMLAPMLAGRAVTHPSDVFEHLSAATSVLALQSGEPGPFAQSIAAIDIALWDLFAKRAKTPLWRMLGGATGGMHIYASGINPAGSVEQAEAAMRRGYRAFKVKIGFDAGKDLEVDSNDNPLREDFCGTIADVKDGEIVLPEAPGLGIELDVKAIDKYRTL